MEDLHCYKPELDCENDSLVMPVAEYSHTDGCSVTRGYVYRGSKITDLHGHYILGDFCTGTIWAIDKNNDFAVTKLLDTNLYISSFGEDQAGNIYIVDYNGGIFQLLP